MQDHTEADRLSTAEEASRVAAGQPRARNVSHAAGLALDQVPPGQAVTAFLATLEGQNKSPATRRAYASDLGQFLRWLEETTYAPSAARVERSDISDFLAHLGRNGVSGVSRARKLAAIREFFRFLVAHDALSKSPAEGIDTPKKEKGVRTYLRPDEYTRMLSLAGGSARDYAILQVFLQTGVRVSELCNLRLTDVDLAGRVLRVVGKGMVTREIELEKKGVAALKNWLAQRPASVYDHLFLNRDGEPLGERGVRKLVTKYRVQAGITKRASCHSLRHTFASYKAQRGVSPFQLKEWLGHANLNTTQIYVHMGRQNAPKVMEATSL